MESDLQQRIIERLGELDELLGEIDATDTGSSIGHRQALLALDRKLAAMAQAIDSER